MKRLTLISVVVLFTNVVKGQAPWNCSDSDVLGLQADGFQFSPSDNVLEALWEEWWFFALYDSSNNFGLIMEYQVNDPGNFFGKANTELLAMIYPTVTGNTDVQVNNTVPITDFYPMSDLVVHSQNASMSMGTGIWISVQNSSVYEVVGASKDGRLSWNLSFTQLADPDRQLVNVPGFMALDWVSYMPASLISGTVSFDGQVYQVDNVVGYHDHNFGYWPEPVFNWVWAQFSGSSDSTQLRATLVAGAYKLPLTNDTYVGYVFLQYGDQRMKFGSLCDDRFELTMLEFVPWHQDPTKKVSVHNIIVTSNEKFRLVVDYKAIVFAPSPVGPSLGLLIFEQISAYNVQLFQESAQGWQLVDSFAGHGFNEWCDFVV